MTIISLQTKGDALRLGVISMSRDIQTFKRIYLDEFNEHLSDEDAERKARVLLDLYIAVYGSLVGDIRNTLEKLSNQSNQYDKDSEEGGA